MSTAVLIVDDQALVRTGFRMILESEPDLEVVGEARDGREAVEAVRSARPDVALMDIRMPVMDGIEATRRIVGSGPEAPRVLMLTTYDLDEYVFEAFQAGASGFLLKDVPPDQLVGGIRVVASGEALVAPAITRRLIETFVSDRARRASRPQGIEELTDRELDVLRLVARGLSNAEIAAHLVVSDTTVKTHVGRILSKLSLRDRVQAVVFAYESGLTSPSA